MRSLLGGADADFLNETRRITLLRGKLFSAVVLVTVGAFIVYALTGPLGTPYLPWSLSGFVPAVLFLALGSDVFARQPALIIPFHALSLLGLQVMVMGIVTRVLLTPERVAGAWIVIPSLLGIAIVIDCFLAAGARPFLWAILILPLSALTLLLLLRREMTESSFVLLSSIWIVSIVCSAMTLVHERAIRRARAAECAAQGRSADLERDLEAVKGRTSELEREVARLQKEIEERKAIEVVLEQRAAIDDLTGVYNRRAGFEILKQSIYLTERYSQPLSLCFIDIDDLKTVNDNWGHPAGDELIRRVIAVLKKHFRKSDYISRLGGDEFLAVLTNCTAEAAGIILDRILADLAEQSGQERRYPLAISYGLAERNPSSDLSADELLRLADNNMYLNKQKKKIKQKEE